MTTTIYKILLFMKRKPGMSVEAFRDYYENHHAPLSAKYARGMKRYIRRYLDPQLHAESGRNDELPYDVITELWFDDEATFNGTVKYISSTIMPSEIVEDEKQLFDRATMRMSTVVETETELESVEKRQARILGDGPRLQPLSVDAFSDDLVEIITRMVAVNTAIDAREKSMLTDLVPGADESPKEEEISNRLRTLPEIIRTMLRHPQLFATQTDVGIQLLGNGALSARNRELAVLRIGWLCQAPYEWGEHVHVAKKVGITSEEIERITQGANAPGWSELERAILTAVEELHGGAMISDATWATLAKHLNDKQLIELPILIGQYQTVAFYQNALRLRPHEGNLGLLAR